MVNSESVVNLDNRRSGRGLPVSPVPAGQRARFTWAPPTMTLRHLSGAVIAFIIGLFLYGKEIESYIAPPLAQVEVKNTVRVGSGLYWTTSFCKLRDLRLDRTEFVFFYRNADGRPYTGHLIPVQNRNEGRPAGSSIRPPGCFTVDFSAELPNDASPEDIIVGEVFYPGLNNWWKISAPFGTVTVPGLPS